MRITIQLVGRYPKKTPISSRMVYFRPIESGCSTEGEVNINAAKSTHRTRLNETNSWKQYRGNYWRSLYSTYFPCGGGKILRVRQRSLSISYISDTLSASAVQLIISRVTKFLLHIVTVGNCTHTQRIKKYSSFAANRT